MFVSLRTITLPAAEDANIDSWIQSLRRYSALLPRVVSNYVAPAISGATINSGQIIWRMVFATEMEAYRVTLDSVWLTDIQPLLEGAQVSGVHYQNSLSKAGRAGAGIWRALVFRIFPEGSPELASQLKEEMLLMPRYVSTIRSWGLNRVAASEGTKQFTWVWEQEFESLEGLTGEYMAHPVHWGIIDRYFDAECPEYIVDPYLLQLVCEIDQTIIN